MDGGAQRLLAGEQQRCLSLENPKCLRNIHSQPHSISREVGTGLSPGGEGTEANSWRRARGDLLGEPALPSLLGWRGSVPGHPPIVCFWGSRAGAVCFRRGEAPALGFGYCSRSEDTVSVAGAHRGGGSLAGGT